MSSLEVVYIEGLPGSGKTTLLENLANRLTDVHIIGEYVISDEADEAIAEDDEEYFLKTMSLNTK